MYGVWLASMILLLVPDSGSSEGHCGFSLSPAPDSGALKQLQGTWVPDSVIYAGVQADLRASQDWHGPRAYRVEHEKLTIECWGGGSVEGDLAIEDSTTPKKIDISFGDGTTVPGIFAVDGNVLVVCVRLGHNKDRPAKFSAEEDQTALYILRRK